MVTISCFAGARGSVEQTPTLLGDPMGCAGHQHVSLTALALQDPGDLGQRQPDAVQNPILMGDSGLFQQ